MAWLTGSVDEIKLVDTVEVVNCFTVLRGVTLLLKVGDSMIFDSI